MSDSTSWLDVSENPGTVLLLGVVVLALVIVVAGFVMFSGQSGGGQAGPNVVMSVEDAPAKYQGAEYLPTETMQILHRAGDDVPGNALTITIINESSGKTVAKWVGGERKGGTAKEVSLMLKRGQSAGEDQGTFATANSISGKTITPADKIVVVDEGKTQDLSKLTTYRVVVVHRDSGEELLNQTTGLK